jgi:1-acyl-sn-glycerol-3-phosphate acyltransferase
MRLPDGWVYPVGNFIMHSGLRAFANYKVEGREGVSPRGGMLVVSNHMSYIDPALLAIAIPRRLHFLAKESAFRTPLVKYILKGYGAFPINRDGRDIKGFRWALDQLQKGEALSIFPEGARNPDGLIKPVPGVVQLHLKSQAPILPVAITGSGHLRGYHRIFTPTGNIKVTIGSPFSLPMFEEKLQKAQVDAMADMIMRRIADLLPESQRGVYSRGSSTPAKPGEH